MSPSVAVGSETPRRAPNPFLSSVSASPLDHNPTDVPEINSGAFQKCLELVDEVREQHFTQTLILMGEPGSGKTHLLSRLRATLEKDSTASRESLFIPIPHGHECPHVVALSASPSGCGVVASTFVLARDQEKRG